MRGIALSQVPALSANLCVYQSELSDGIAMLVAGNDRVQAVITQMEEVCQTIEVSLGWRAGGNSN